MDSPARQIEDVAPPQDGIQHQGAQLLHFEIVARPARQNLVLGPGTKDPPPLPAAELHYEDVDVVVVRREPLVPQRRRDVRVGADGAAPEALERGDDGAQGTVVALRVEDPRRGSPEQGVAEVGGADARGGRRRRLGAGVQRPADPGPGVEPHDVDARPERVVVAPQEVEEVGGREERLDDRASLPAAGAPPHEDGPLLEAGVEEGAQGEGREKGREHRGPGGLGARRRAAV